LPDQLGRAGRKGIAKAVPFYVRLSEVDFIVMVVAVKIFIDYALHLLAELPACRPCLFILKEIENPKLLPAPHALKDPIMRIRLQG